jgi:hypothetical protein
MIALSRNTNVAAGVLGDLASFGGNQLGGKLSGFVNTLDKGRQDTSAAFKQGLGNLDLTGLQQQLKQGRISNEEYLKLMSRAGPGLQGLGGSAEKTGKMLTDLAERGRQSDFGKQLESYGIAVDKELVHINAVGSLGARNLGRTQKEQDEFRDKLAVSNARLAYEIANQSQLTGKSRDAITAELEERLKQPGVMLRMRQMTEEQREAFVRNQVALSGMGESAQRVSANIGVGGKPTEEQRNFMASLGPAAASFQRASALIARGRTAEDREAGRALMEKAMGQAAKYRDSKEYANVVNAGGERGEYFAKVQREDTTGQRVADILKKNPALTERQAYRQARKEAELEAPKVVSTDPRRKIQQELQGMEGKAQEAGYTAAKRIDKFAREEGGAEALAGGIKKLGDTLFDTKKEGDKFVEFLHQMIAEMKSYTKEKVDAAKPNTSTSPSGNTPTPPPANATRPQGNTPPPPANATIPQGNTPPAPAVNPVTQGNPLPAPAVNPVTQGNPLPAPRPITVPATEPARGRPTMENDPRLNGAPPVTAPPVPRIETPAVTPPRNTGPSAAPSGNTPLPPISRANTSLGEVGSLIEKFSPKGTPALLHNEEGVVSLEQLNNIARGSKNSGIETALSGMQAMMGAKQTAMPRVDKEQPQANAGITNMMNNIRSYTGNMQASIKNQTQTTKPDFDYTKMFEGVKTKVSPLNVPKVDYDINTFKNNSLKAPATVEEPKTSITPSVAQQQLSNNADQVSLKDVNDTLNRLNTGIMQLVQHSAKAVDLNQAQVKATKSLSGNKFA